MEIIIKIDPTKCEGQTAVFAVLDKDYADYVTTAELIDSIDMFGNKVVDLCFQFAMKQNPSLSVHSEEFRAKCRDVKISDIFPPELASIINSPKPSQS